MAACHPDEFALTAYKFPEKVVAGIDARDGMFAVKGWTEQTDITAVYFGKKCKKMGIRYALFTDISKDGAMEGCNVCETIRIQKETELQVIASGGISSLKDIENLRDSGIYGAVLGKSIYSGAVDLKEARAGKMTAFSLWTGKCRNYVPFSTQTPAIHANFAK